MANEYRGEVPFLALGREMYLAYGIRELAEAKAALGFHPPDPAVPAMEEQVAEEEVVRFTDGKPQTGKDGLPLTKVVRRSVVVDYAVRRRRIDEAFGQALEDPGVDGLLVLLRLGLRRWERHLGVRLTEVDFDRLWDEVGYDGLRNLHWRAARRAFRIEPAADEGQDPNAQSTTPAAVPTPSTSIGS